MTIKIISGLLILITVYFGITHGSRALSKASPAYAEMMTLLGVTNNTRIVIGIWSVLSAILILFPQTFFFGNIARAVLLLVLMAFALKQEIINLQ
jgi:hypothetical protein